MGCDELKGKNYPIILFTFEYDNEVQKNYCLKLKDNYVHNRTIRYDIKSNESTSFSIKLKINDNIYDIQSSFNDSEEDMQKALQNIYDILDKYGDTDQKREKDKEVDISLDKDILDKEKYKDMKNKILKEQKDLRNENNKIKDIKENEKSVESETKEEIKEIEKTEEIIIEKEKDKKVNKVLEDMCIYGNIAKKEIKEEKKKNPEKFIETKEALKLENEDKGLFALGLISQNLEDIGVETAIEKNSDNDEGEEGLTSMQFISNGFIAKKNMIYILNLAKKEMKNY